MNTPGISIGKHHLHHSQAHAASAPNTGTEQLHISMPLIGPRGTKRGGGPSALHTDGGKAIISVSGFSSLEFSGIICVCEDKTCAKMGNPFLPVKNGNSETDTDVLEQTI